MLEDRRSPAQEAGEAVRQLHPLRRWVEIREFYRSLFGRRRHVAISQLTTFTTFVWADPDYYR